MTLEYVLLLALFVFLVMGAMVKGPRDSFHKSGPLLGARVEKQIITGDGFMYQGKHQINWTGSEGQ